VARCRCLAARARDRLAPAHRRPASSSRPDDARQLATRGARCTRHASGRGSCLRAALRRSSARGDTALLQHLVPRTAHGVWSAPTSHQSYIDRPGNRHSDTASRPAPPPRRGAARGRGARCMAEAGTPDGPAEDASQPSSSMRSSGRRGRFSTRSASSAACKPGVELSNTLDEDCTVIRRAARQQPPRMWQGPAHAASTDAATLRAAGRLRRGDALRVAARRCCAAAERGGAAPHMRGTLNLRCAAQSGVRGPCWPVAGLDRAPQSAAGALSPARRCLPVSRAAVLRLQTH